MHATQTADAVLQIRDVTVGYQPGRPVLSAFSMVLDGPALVQVQGRNGAGKSTVLELLSGYLPPWRGTVTIGGLDASRDDARRMRRVCRTEPALYPHMTVRDHLVFAARCRSADPGPGLERAKEYGLEPWFEHDAKSLSTGNRRKTWLIFCTLGDFGVVVLDEPFNGLDDESSERLVMELKNWAATRLVVLISHAPPVGVAADRVITIGEG